MSEQSLASTSTRRVLRNAVATLGVRGVWQLFRFFTILATMAALGPERWGQYGLLVSSLELVRALTNFGLDTAAVRWMSMPGADRAAVLWRVTRIKTVLATLGVLVMAAVSWGREGPAEMRFLPLLLALGLFPQGWTGSLVARFQAEHSMHWLIPVQAVLGGVQLSLVSVLARLGAGVPGFIGLLVVFDYLAFAATLLMSRRAWRSVPHEVPARVGSAWSLFLEGLPLGVVELVVIAYGRLGVFLLERHASTVAVGHLYAAMKVNEQVLVVAGALATSALPAFARLAAEGHADRIRRAYARYSAGALVFSSVLAAVLSLAGPALIARVKPEYAAAGAPLVALSWAGIFMFQNQLSTTVITSYGRFRWIAGCAVLNLCVYAVLSTWLVPLHGALGAALATLGTEALNACVQVALVLKVLREAPQQPVVQSAAA